MPVNQTFKPLSAMELRTNPGSILDRVDLQNQRFAIQRRGKTKALLVPVSDGQNIKAQVTTDQLDQTYQALDSIKGIVTDPALQDASGTIDERLYGQLDQESNE